MEGVPRIPMLSFPMRRSADTPHFKSRLKSFISNHYNEDPESYATEIHELESLRASAVHVSKDYSGCSTLKKYFCQLNFLKSRFPMNEGGTCAISFSWYDVFSETVHGWSDVDFEMSCVLFNIGALHSELGALDNRQTADGMKTSCTHFQCAAWAFSHLRHNYQKYFTPDVSPDMLNILMNICLAQAQECILEKSLIDNRKSTITAKVALQIVEYYSTANRISDGMLKDAAQYSDKLIKAVKKWKKLVELKVQYYGCIAYLYRGMQAEDQSKWGERVTMYKAAAEKMNESIKLAKNLEKTDPIHDTLHFTLDVVGGKVAIAEKENEFIYHEKVPDLEAVMSDVKAVSLVKGIQFKFDDPQVAGPDIFGRLVPMEAHEASSLYSEEKAKILRTYSRKIEEKNEALDKFVLPLQLEQLELHDSDKIPQELIDCCAALSVNPDTVKRLSELMSTLSSLYHDVQANLEEIQDHLADQEKREKEYQEVVGKRPPNNIISEINRELDKYLSAQAVAAESNNNLREAMNTHVQNLTILMKPLDEVMKKIPTFGELEKNEEAFERMKKLSGKVGEMRKQRELLESQLRDSILNDDITKSLVVKKGEDLDTVFKDELQKHDKITQLLDQNLLAQENIIRALTEANAEYAETRSATVELKRKRDTVIQSMIGSYEAYDELIAKCNIGIEFYTKLNSNVEKLLQRMRSVCKVQNEERDINMERIIRKAQQPPPGMPSIVGGMPGANMGGAGVGAYQTPMMQGYPYPSTTISPSIPPPSSSTPAATTRLPSTGGHLKLKDYLAMKKEGKLPGPGGLPSQAAAAGHMPNNNMAKMPTYPNPASSAMQQPAGYDPSVYQTTNPSGPATSNMPSYNNTGIQPQLQQTTPGVSAATGMPPSPYQTSNTGHQLPNQMSQLPASVPTTAISHVPTQQPPSLQQPHYTLVSSANTPAPSAMPQQAGYLPGTVPQQQQQPGSVPTPYTPAATGMNHTNHTPVASNNVNKYTPQPQQQLPSNYSYPVAPTQPTNNHQQASIAPQPQSQQHPIQGGQMPGSSPSPASYNNYNSAAPVPFYPSPSSTPPVPAPTPPNAPPVSNQQGNHNMAYPQSSTGYYTAPPAASYGQGYSGTGQTLPGQNYAVPGQQNQNYNSVGQTQQQRQTYPATVPSQQQNYAPTSGQQQPGQIYQNQQQNYPSGPQQNYIPTTIGQQPQQKNYGPTMGQQQQPSYNSVNNSTGQQQAYNSGSNPTGQQQNYNSTGTGSIGQATQPPSAIDTNSYSQTSFLAQYVRQHQGCRSTNQAPTSTGAGVGTFPNFTGGAFTNQQPMSYPQSSGTGFGGATPAPNQYLTGYGQQQPQQQWQNQSQVPPQSNQQQQPPSSYPPPSSGQTAYQVPQQQQYQPQYGNQQQIQTPNYYNNAASAPPQQQQPSNQSVPYQSPSQTQFTQPSPHSQQQPQPHQQQSTIVPPPKQFGNSNMDLLTGIDFNAATEPLAPVVLHQQAQNSTQNS